jgi:hypothetical protein
MNNWNEDQINRFIDSQTTIADALYNLASQQQKNVEVTKDVAEATKEVADSNYTIASAIAGMYNGEGKSALWGISQALFMAVNAENRGEGIHIKIDKD